MKVKKSGFYLAMTAVMVLLAAATGCSDRNPAELEVARAEINPVVFDDDYSQVVYFQPFFNTHYTAASIDSTFAFGGSAFDGARSLKFNVAPENAALGLYTGGVLTAVGARDFADYNALTFYARASRDIQLDVAGFGNDNTGNSLYEAGRFNIALTGDWSFVIVPIPAPSRLVAERGLFTIAESREDAYPEGYDIWIDEIRYARLSNIEPIRASMNVVQQSVFVGTRVPIAGTSTIYSVDGGFIPVQHSPNYFDYQSSDPDVAVADGGIVTAVGPGAARITGTLENFFDPGSPFEVLGWVDVTAYVPPTEAAPAPTHPAAGVVSLFSDAYDDILVDTWRADWSTASFRDYSVAGNPVKMYSGLGYVGIMFETSPVNTTPLTHFHLDVYAPAGTGFHAKLACVPGPDWTFPNNEPPQVEIELNADTTPAFVSGDWSSLDIPLTSFQTVSHTQPEDFDWTQVNQLILSTGATADTKLVLVDNIYFHP